MDFLSLLFNRPAIHQLEPAEVHARIAQTPRPFLLDVRTPGEYKQGHITGAELIPLNELAARVGRLPRQRQIICVCASGHRSSAAARQLTAKGFPVSNLKGGMAGWMRAGLPVKKGAAK
jgi:rhodanese-related sulfurtransferase